MTPEQQQSLEDRFGEAVKQRFAALRPVEMNELMAVGPMFGWRDLLDELLLPALREALTSDVVECSDCAKLHTAIITEFMGKLWSIPSYERVALSDEELIRAAGAELNRVRVEVEELRSMLGGAAC